MSLIGTLTIGHIQSNITIHTTNDDMNPFYKFEQNTIPNDQYPMINTHYYSKKNLIIQSLITIAHHLYSMIYSIEFIKFVKLILYTFCSDR